MLVDNRR
jgi:hypothetical protein